MLKISKILLALFLVGLFFVKDTKAQVGSLRINEIAWMGTDVSSNDEWIEILNQSGEEVILDGWVLEAVDGSPKILLSGSVEAGGYFLLERTDDNSVPGILADQIYSGALGNSGETLVLKNDLGDEVDRVSADGAWPEGNKELKLTMERVGVSTWQSSLEALGTPHSVNSAGKSISSQDDEVSIDEKGEADEVVKDSESNASDNNLTVKEKALALGYDYKETIVISEVFPSPFGGYSELEFIELYNFGDKEIDLRAWRVEDASGMDFELEGKIEAGDFFVLYREESNIALNNNGDKIFLFQPFLDKPFLELKYGSASKGMSYSLFDYDPDRLRLGILDYAWNDKLTPGKKTLREEKNEAPLIDFYCPDVIEVARPQLFDSSDTVDSEGDKLKYFWDFGDGATNTLAVPEHTFFEAGEYKVYLSVFDGVNKVTKEKLVKVQGEDDLSLAPANEKPIDLDKKYAENENQDENKENIFSSKDDTQDMDGTKIKTEEYFFDIGSKVTILGVVAVLPGVLGTQFFYVLENEESSIGIQVYNYKKDFPESLQVGDLLEVTGEIVETQGEKRIKTKSKDDMKIISTGKSVTAKEMIIKEIGDEQIGNFLSVAGEVVEKKSSYVYVDDGSDEIRVYLKSSSGLSGKIFTEGEEVKIFGILSKTSSGLRLMPRSPQDVEFMENEEESFDEEEEPVSDGVGQVLGEQEKINEKPEWLIPQREVGLSWYLVVFLLFLNFVLLVLLFKRGQKVA